MKKIGFLISVIFLAGCNAEIKNDSIPTSKIEALTNLGELDSTEKTSDAVITKTVESTQTNTAKNITNARIAAKLLLIARGTEPGWYAEFYSNKGKILLDYGKDSLMVDCDFEKITEKEFSKTIAIQQNNGTANLTINIKNKKCIEAGSGDEKDRQIELKVGNKIYKGCATLK